MHSLPKKSDCSFNQAVTLRESGFSHPNDIQLKQWSVSQANVTYCQSEFHTLSLYLKGGERTFRQDKKDRKGGIGKVCVMPQGHLSRWSIQDDIDFLHLYFTDTQFKSYISLNFDLDVRSISLKDVIYAQNPSITQLMLYFQHCCHNNDASYIEKDEVLNNLFGQIALTCTAERLNMKMLAGGLSSFDIKRIKTFIHDNLELPLTIEQLAAHINLSPFHFARMFRISFGETVAQYIISLRVKQAKTLLRTSQSLAEISASSGFSHQSHMTSVFKKRVGLTPKKFRQGGKSVSKCDNTRRVLRHKKSA